MKRGTYLKAIVRYFIWISSLLSTVEKFVLIKHNNRKLRNYVVGLFLPSKKQQAVSTVYRDVLKCTSKRGTGIPSADREGESVQEGQGWERKVDVRWGLEVREDTCWKQRPLRPIDLRDVTNVSFAKWKL